MINTVQPGNSYHSRDVISPKSATPNPKQFYVQPERINQFALFQERILKTDQKDTLIPIYNSRSAYFFMSKMEVEGDGCYSICKASCSICYKSSEHPFFLIPQYTQWLGLGDYGVVINLNTKEQQAAYAICVDFEKHETKIINGNTVFRGKIGKGSIALGKALNINDIAPNPLAAFQPFKIVYIIFPNTHSPAKNRIKTVKEINEEAHRAFQDWGGWPYAQFVIKEKYDIILN